MTSPTIPEADYATRAATAAQNAFAATSATNQLPGVGNPPVDSTDTDSDGLTDRFESLVGTNAVKPDSDKDGLVDGYEEMVSHTDPMLADTDHDGTNDAEEIVAHTDPVSTARVAADGGGGAARVAAGGGGIPAGDGDADLDGLTDYFESRLGTDASDPDTDHDGVADNFEATVGTNPLLIDTDRDGALDGSEITSGSDPLTASVAPAAAPAAVTTVIVVTPPAAGTDGAPATAPASTNAEVSSQPSAAATGTVQHMLDKAMAQVGDDYVFGADVAETDPDPSVWDCAEFTQWSAHQAGAEIPGSSFEQYLDLKAKGLLIPVDEAMNTPGALLFHFSAEPQPGGGRPAEAHVALSIGGGQTVEAQSSEVGVITDDAAGRFEYAALLPGIDYGNAPAASAIDPAETTGADGNTPDASGLTLDQVIYGIKIQESHGDYTAENPTSTASGAYQYIDGTWDGHAGFSHASEAPPDVQDAKMRADTEAAYNRLGDWERVIASHFAGENGQEGPKSEWDKVPGYESNHNPSIRDYVDGVKGHIGDADPSAFPATTPPTTATAAAAVQSAQSVTESTVVTVPTGEPDSGSPAVTVIGPPGSTISVTVTQPGPPTGPADPTAAVQDSANPGGGVLAGQGGMGGQPSTVGQGAAGQGSTEGQPGAIGQPSAPTPNSAGTPDPAPPIAPGFQIDPGVDISDPDADSDADGLSNRFEAQVGTNPTVVDTDGDGLYDGMEETLQTDPLNVDSDGDGFTDSSELHFGLDPLASTLISPLDDVDPEESEPPDAADHPLTLVADALP